MLQDQAVQNEKSGSQETQDWPKTFSSQQGFYTVTVEPVSVTRSQLTVPMRRLHQWKMHLARANGELVSGARVLLDGGMPAHAHGLPSVPKVRAVSNEGDYIIEGMKFNMGGEWLLRFTIIHDQKDRAQLTFQLAH